MAGDRQFAKEIEFDLHKLEEEEQQERARAQKEKEKEKKSEEERINAKPASIESCIHLDNNKCLEDNQNNILENENTIENQENEGEKISLSEERQENTEYVEAAREEDRVNINLKDTSKQCSDNIKTRAPASPILTKRCSVLLKRVLNKCQKEANEKYQNSLNSTAIGSSLRTANKMAAKNPNTEIENKNEDGEQSQMNTNTIINSKCDEIEKSVERLDEEDTSIKGITPAPLNSRTPIKKKQTEETRDKLMRAISTPNPNKKVINNITFVDRTREISSISYEESTRISPERGSLSRDDDDDRSHKLLLHFRSPEAFAKDDEFSRLRRSYKKSLIQKFDQVQNKKEVGKRSQKQNQASTQRSSGGFLESIVEDEIFSDDDSSLADAPVIDEIMEGPSNERTLLSSTQKQRQSKLSKNNKDGSKPSKRSHTDVSHSPIVKAKTTKRSRYKSKK